jgi:hypothetical protein
MVSAKQTAHCIGPREELLLQPHLLLQAQLLVLMVLRALLAYMIKVKVKPERSGMRLAGSDWHSSALTTLTGCAHYTLPHELTITASNTATALNVRRKQHSQLQLRTHGAATHS